VSTYHHGNLRPALIEAAAELARTDGPDGVVLREVARRTGVSHNAAYRHFADRDALLSEVAAIAMERLGEAMQSRLDEVDVADPKLRTAEQLQAVGRAYVDFALAEPGLFEVAFAGGTAGMPEQASEATDDEAGAANPYALLNEVLDACVAAGSVAPDRRPGADVVCWAAVHGFAVLHLDGPLRDLPAEERTATLEVMLDHISRGLA
jgi:AcrR family transcriptional regulator